LRVLVDGRVFAVPIYPKKSKFFQISFETDVGFILISFFSLNFSKNRNPAVSKSFETLTIYLNDLKPVSTTNKDLQQQDSPTTAPLSFYFIEIHIINTKQNNKISYFQSSLFQLSDHVNDLCQIPLEYDHNTSLRFFLFKLGTVTTDKSLAVQLGASNIIEACNRRSVETMSEVYLITGSNQKIFSLKFRCSYESEYYPTSKIRTVVDLYNFRLATTAESEKNLLDLVEDFNGKGSGLEEPVLIRKFLEFFAVLNMALPNDELLVGKKNDRRLTRSKNRIYNFFFLLFLYLLFV